MPIFQKSVVNKYIKTLDESAVNQAFEQFTKFYGNLLRRMNIVTLNEENYQEGFLREIFVNVLGYTINPDIDFNLTTEYKNQTDSKKADGAILKNGQAIGVIELKSTKRAFLDSITNQAFNYKHNQSNCRYVITSNFHNLRFYIDNSTENEEFDLFEMADYKVVSTEFKRFYLFLSCESILNDLPAGLKDETKFQEESITDKFYKDYKICKDNIYNSLVNNNKQYDKLIIYKKTQKLLDRILFILFAEDNGLIPPNAISRTVEKWKVIVNEGINISLYSRFQALFTHLNQGFVYPNWGEIPAYNGGLFKYDDILDNSDLIIENKFLEIDSLKLATYDFNSEIDVNILGHIFEHSLNELEELSAQFQGVTIDKTKLKRKKEGVFYTPKFITKYIIEKTIGSYCAIKKEELKLNLADLRTNSEILTNESKELFDKLTTYKNWLFNLKILDPACGSGAFLIEALHFLIHEHKEIDDRICELENKPIRLFDTDKIVLEKNIYGVDINEESVEITKLSLWLNTAKKERKLSDLNNNIKCGNSLINNLEIAGDKTFDWNNEFPDIMQNGGFDIVIGNPPYVRADIDKPDYQAQRRWMETCGQYQTLYEKWDLMVAFYEKSLNLLKPAGFHGFIASNAITTSKYALKLHEHIIEKYCLQSIDYFEDMEVFKKVGVIPVITIIRNKMPELNFKKIIRKKIFEESTETVISFDNYESIVPIKVFKKYYDKIDISVINELLGNICYLSVGMVINADEIYSKGLFAKDDIISFEETKIHTKPFVEGKDLKDYLIERIKFLEWDTDRVPSKLRRKTFPELYIGEKIMRGRVTGAVYDNTGIVCNDGVIVFKRFCDLHDINQLSINSSITKNNSIPRNELEIISEEFELKYILSIINSSFAYWFLNNNRRHRLENYFYPDDFRNLPIPRVDKQQQSLFVDEVDKILLNYSKLKKSEMFIGRIKTHLKIKTITQRLSEFYKYNFNSFIVELNKQNIKLNLKQSDEWEEYFNSYANELKIIFETITESTENLNNMIYNLFNLSIDEITIIQSTTH